MTSEQTTLPAAPQPRTNNRLTHANRYALGKYLEQVWPDIVAGPGTMTQQYVAERATSLLGFRVTPSNIRTVCDQELDRKWPHSSHGGGADPRQLAELRASTEADLLKLVNQLLDIAAAVEPVVAFVASRNPEQELHLGQPILRDDFLQLRSRLLRC